MKGFLLGLLCAGLAFAGYYVWRQHQSPATVPAPSIEASAPAAGKKPKKKPRSALRLARAAAAVESGAGEPVAEPIMLSASDLRTVAQGDDLSTPDVLRLDMSNDKELPELTQDQIDEQFHGQESAILECIARARPDPETYVPGRVTIKFRIQRSGTVRGVRVEAPSILQKNGLFGCIKGTLLRMRFPRAGTSQIVSYPFRLS